MKTIALLLALIMPSLAIANEQINWLQENNPSEYFPKDAEYLNIGEACNGVTCFKLISVSYVTLTSKGMQRVAVFSSSSIYLGVYSGFQELPLSVSGSQLIFPDSEFGHIISFNGILPPLVAYIDGEHFEFEPKP
ncbi:hypothetical protein [Catenovulum sediminis]|uniref:Uncharacterized protein n=1 Tax=Catenovulum sediminis TaxID=1740262 RepID=A0ABV1RFA8_9ALTE